MLLRRAQPLLGTLVNVQVKATHDPAQAQPAIDAAFSVIARIDRVMSAHRSDSDLARIAAAGSGAMLDVDPHTAAVLQLAERWRSASRGAFDASAAGVRLAARGLRPGIASARAGARWKVTDDGRVAIIVAGAVDLGGIAKGYAVDRAIEALQAHGATSALVNAGGDLRAIGPVPWAIEARHANVPARSQRFARLRGAALASSVAGTANGEFVATRGTCWQRATVMARDCATADALTKWALQETGTSLRLKAALRSAGARLWRD